MWLLQTLGLTTVGLGWKPAPGKVFGRSKEGSARARLRLKLDRRKDPSVSSPWSETKQTISSYPRGNRGRGVVALPGTRE